MDAHQLRVEALAGGSDLAWFEWVERAAGDVPGELVAEGGGEAGAVPAGRVGLERVHECGGVVHAPRPAVPCENVGHVADLLVADPVAAGPQARATQHARGGGRAVLAPGHGQASEPG